ICAETTEEAQRLAASARMSFRLLRQGKLTPVPPPGKAQRFLDQQDGGGGSAPGPGRGRRAGVGGPGEGREGVEQGARDCGAGEVMVVTITYDHEARKRSYELIAEAFGLSGVTEAPASATVP